MNRVKTTVMSGTGRDGTAGAVDKYMSAVPNGNNEKYSYLHFFVEDMEQYVADLGTMLRFEAQCTCEQMTAFGSTFKLKSGAIQTVNVKPTDYLDAINAKRMSHISSSKQKKYDSEAHKIVKRMGNVCSHLVSDHSFSQVKDEKLMLITREILIHRKTNCSHFMNSQATRILAKAAMTIEKRKSIRDQMALPVRPGRGLVSKQEKQNLMDRRYSLPTSSLSDFVSLSKNRQGARDEESLMESIQVPQEDEEFEELVREFQERHSAAGKIIKYINLCKDAHTAFFSSFASLGHSLHDFYSGDKRKEMYFVEMSRHLTRTTNLLRAEHERLQKLAQDNVYSILEEGQAIYDKLGAMVSELDRRKIEHENMRNRCENMRNHPTKLRKYVEQVNEAYVELEELQSQLHERLSFFMTQRATPLDQALYGLVDSEFNLMMEASELMKAPATIRQEQSIGDNFVYEDNIDESNSFSEVSYLLDSQIGIFYLRRFAKQELNDENFRFLSRADKYRKMKSQSNRKKEIVDIVKTFISQEAPEQLNLSTASRTLLEKSASTSKGALAFFDEARAEVVQLIARDSFPRFKLTDEYEEMKVRMTATHSVVPYNVFDVASSAGRGRGDKRRENQHNLRNVRTLPALELRMPDKKKSKSFTRKSLSKASSREAGVSLVKKEASLMSHGSADTLGALRSGHAADSTGKHSRTSSIGSTSSLPRSSGSMKSLTRSSSSSSGSSLSLMPIEKKLRTVLDESEEFISVDRTGKTIFEPRYLTGQREHQFRTLLPTEGSNSVKIEINGENFVSQEGVSVMQALSDNGFFIPRLCFHPRLRPITSCGFCAVSLKIGGYERVVTSCSTPIRDGMKITANKGKEKVALRDALRSILKRRAARGYPEVSAEDKVLTQAVHHSRQINKDVSSPAIVFDTEQCVECGRCVYACRDIAGQDVFKMGDRESSMCRISTSNKLSLKEANCVNCGQCVLYCPTNSLVEHSSVRELCSALDDNKKVHIAMVDRMTVVALSEMYKEMGHITGVFRDADVVNALKSAGFKYVFSSQHGNIIETLENAADFISRVKTKRRLPMIVSTCPSTVHLIQSQFPHLLKFLGTCRSSEVSLSRLIRKQFVPEIGVDSQHIVVTSFSGCAAKKLDTSKLTGKDLIDHLVTTRQLKDFLKRRSVDIVSIAKKRMKHEEQAKPKETGTPKIESKIAEEKEEKEEKKEESPNTKPKDKETPEQSKSEDGDKSETGSTEEDAKEETKESSSPAEKNEEKAKGGIENFIDESPFDEPFKQVDYRMDENSVAGCFTMNVMKCAYEITKKRILSGVKFTRHESIDNVLEAAITFPTRKINIAIAIGGIAVKSLLKDLPKLKYNFYELFWCPGGCVDGGGLPKTESYSIVEDRGKVLWSMIEENKRKHDVFSLKDIVAKCYTPYLQKPLSSISKRLLHEKQALDLTHEQFKSKLDARMSISKESGGINFESVYAPEDLDEEQINKLKKVTVLYATTTGLSADLAARASILLSGFGLYVRCIDLMSLRGMEVGEFALESTILFFMPSFSDYSFPESARGLWEWVNSDGIDLTKLQYAVFGVGCSRFASFNYAAHQLDIRLSLVGGTKITECVDGDSVDGYEERLKEFVNVTSEDVLRKKR